MTSRLKLIGAKMHPLRRHVERVGLDLALRQGALHCILDICVVEDDERGLAAQLQGHVADALRAGLEI